MNDREDLGADPAGADATAEQPVGSDVVLLEVSDRVAVLTLNRPDRLNAWTQGMQRRYFDLLAGCGEREDVRAIVVTGAGRGFCAGADMEDLQAIGAGAGANPAAPGREAEEAAGRDGGAEHDARPQAFPLTIPKPIIAAINGPCAGLGLVQALMCDLRFAAADAKITTAFARRGLVAEHGISWILPRLIGPARALDLLLSARVVLGSEAAEMGLVNRAVEDGRTLEVALDYARELATHSAPSSMAAAKRQVYTDLDRGLEPAVAEANQLMGESLQAPDFVEGVRSFVERREPDFAPLSSA
jgi:enoyl-CoA hydratase/carnithine racemase